VNLRRPLSGALIAAAALAALAVPAGAATTKPKTTWLHQTLPCATGHKSATVTQKWRGDTLQKSWYTNPCATDWLDFSWCQPDSQSDCSLVQYGPHHKGEIDLEYWGGLVPAPQTCGGGPEEVYLNGVVVPEC